MFEAEVISEKEIFFLGVLLAQVLELKANLSLITIILAVYNRRGLLTADFY